MGKHSSRSQRRPLVLGKVGVGAVLALTTFGSSAIAAADTGHDCDGVSSVKHDQKKNVVAISSPSPTTSTDVNDGTGPLGTSPVKPVTKVASSPTVTGGRTSPVAQVAPAPRDSTSPVKPVATVSSSPTVTGSATSSLAQAALAPGDSNPPFNSPPFNTGTTGTGNVDSGQNFGVGFNFFNVGNDNTTVANNHGRGTNAVAVGNGNTVSGTNSVDGLINLVSAGDGNAYSGNNFGSAFNIVTLGNG
ncbi:MAG: hypothetical protein JWR11_2785, partial [Mycobacterium sp.]|nr:hypothetical protein [Mycobacterium sp.]